jgi:AcrR family transcriptional regulator
LPVRVQRWIDKIIKVKKMNKTNDKKILSRVEKAQEKRRAIIEAAKNEFLSKGFAAARIDEIAKKAGVAKGTVYLYFPNKEAMFDEIVKTVMMPMINRMREGLKEQSLATKTVYEPMFLSLLKSMLAPDVGPVMRLLISEAIRFPKLGDFFRREVVMPMIEKHKVLLKCAAEAGELRNPAMAKYPQLIMAPIILTVIWQGMFSQLVPADVSEMIKVHFDLLFKDSTIR